MAWSEMGIVLSISQCVLFVLSMPWVPMLLLVTLSNLD